MAVLKFERILSTVVKFYEIVSEHKGLLQIAKLLRYGVNLSLKKYFYVI